MHVLVTGGAGYIGSHIVKELCDQNVQVTVFDNFNTGLHENLDARAALIEGDIKNTSDLEKAFSESYDAVFHFAALKAVGESMEKPDIYAKNNICGTLNILNIMAEKGVSNFIFSSSAAVYGTPQYLPVDEKHPCHPESYYGYTKYAIEENLKWYSQLKNIRFAALRYFNATGYDINGAITGQEKNPANLCPIVMETAAGIREKMQVFGNDYDTPDGTGVRDYIHVNDLATAHVLAMRYLTDEKKDLIVNLGTGQGHSVLEMIKTAEEVTGRKINYEIVGRRAGDPREIVASGELARKLLGWEARYSDLETIFKTMAPVYLK